MKTEQTKDGQIKKTDYKSCKPFKDYVDLFSNAKGSYKEKEFHILTNHHRKQLELLLKDSSH